MLGQDDCQTAKIETGDMCVCRAARPLVRCSLFDGSAHAIIRPVLRPERQQEKGAAQLGPFHRLLHFLAPELTSFLGIISVLTSNRQAVSSGTAS